MILTFINVILSVSKYITLIKTISKAAIFTNFYNIKFYVFMQTKYNN